MSAKDALERLALAEEALYRLRHRRSEPSNADPLTRAAEAEEEVARLSAEIIRREDELADRERMASSRNYESTAFPEIFKDTYWGGQHGAAAVICRNRNLFASVYAIKTQHINQVVAGYAAYGMNGRFRKFFDHSEMYRTHDDRFALVVSPYDYVDGADMVYGNNRYKVNDFISACGFTVIPPIYRRHAISMVKIGGVKDFIDYRVLLHDL
ncbi:hypothetical protein PINS_up016452 [Pythium insidiosum]|nr:hypothetical protein PINS_up008756 [Pythium insidiosum]GLE06826.1 hypothetical protein PINS_up016452 [Pythium insidiosum]